MKLPIRISAGKWGLPLLAVTAFTEAIINPFPPDIFVLSIAYARRDRWYVPALVSTFCSVLGGLVGFYLGMYAFEFVAQIMQDLSMLDTFERASGLYREYGFAAVFIAGFTPIPYKVFTIAAGVADVPLLTFVTGSIVSRGVRYLILAYLAYQMGDKAKEWIEQNFNRLTWAVALVVVVLAIIKNTIFT